MAAASGGEMERVDEGEDVPDAGPLTGMAAASGGEMERVDEGEDVPDAGPLHRLTTAPDLLIPGTTVTIGTSADYSPEFAAEVAGMVNTAYGYGRISPSEIRQRLAMGDADEEANRVLHLAWRNNKVVGCCSSTIQTPWCPRGCGHWGLLVVGVHAQGTGVASALVASAEARLAEKGLANVQIEYEYTCGDPASERLLAWYEGRLGFHGGGVPTTSHGRCEWRRLRKRLEPRGGSRSPSSSSPSMSAASSRSPNSKGGGRSSSDTCCGWFARMRRMLMA